MESYTEGSNPRKALFGGIAFPTKVALGSFLPSVSYIVKLPNITHLKNKPNFVNTDICEMSIYKLN